MIVEEGITADALVVPGDFANRSCPEGLNQAWDHCREIAEALHASQIIPVIGNHDIDSKRIRPDEGVFDRVQNLRQNFPFALSSDNNKYFAEGYCVIPLGDVQYIALNTVLGHTDDASAKRGTFTEDRIYRMEASLTPLLRAPIRIAVMHHHPVLHSAAFWADRDVLQHGDALVTALRRMGCRVIIHGHKHVPRLQILNNIAVFASGSFSAMLQEYGTAVGNTFHLMKVRGDGPESIKGEINTWVFQLAKGWHRSSEAYRGFPYSTGFGAAQNVTVIAESLLALSNERSSTMRFDQNEVMERTPELKYLTPDQTADLRALLSPHNLQLMITEDGHIELGRKYQP
jgi:predicted phosphodiesterase